MHWRQIPGGFFDFALFFEFLAVFSGTMTNIENQIKFAHVLARALSDDVLKWQIGASFKIPHVTSMRTSDLLVSLTPAFVIFLKIMASLSGVAHVLRDLMPTTGDVDVTADDIRIAARAWALVKNMVYGGSDGEERDGVVDMEEVDSFELLDADDPSTGGLVGGLKRLKFDDWSPAKRQKVLDAYDAAPEGKKLASIRVLLSPAQRSTITNCDIDRLRKGHYQDKRREVREYMRDKFVAARASKQLVTTLDLRFWAKIRAMELGMTDFTASKSWLYNQKAYVRWSGRRVTRIVTYKEQREVASGQMSEVMLKAVIVIKDRILSLGVSHSRIINFDQSGFRFDYAPQRTLSHTGERDTEVAVPSKDKTTHSYSIQVAMSAAGTLVGPVHVMLKEGGEQFGDRIKPVVDQFLASLPPGQVMVSCNTSGKFGGSSLGPFVAAFMTILGSDHPVLVIKDSWTGQTGGKSDEVYDQHPKLYHETLPPKTTSGLQPEDLVLFHPWKLFWRETIVHVRFCEIAVDFSQRLNIILLHALIRNQLVSITFRELMIYGFSKPGIIPDDSEGPGCFESAKTVWFPFNRNQQSCSKHTDMSPCGKVFIFCSHCRLPLCFHHFFGVRKLSSDDQEEMVPHFHV